MVKFHIKKDGTPGVCNAEKGNCPYGDAQHHFPSQEAAQEYVDKVNLEKVKQEKQNSRIAHIDSQKLDELFFNKEFTAHLQDKMRELSNDDLGELYLNISSKIDNPITKLNTPENVQWITENALGDIKTISEWENYSEDDKYIEYDWDQDEPTSTSDARDLWELDADYLEPDFSSTLLFTYMDAKDIDKYFSERGISIDFEKFIDDDEG